MSTTRERAEKLAQEFLKVSSQFQLGDLTTESAHKETVGLAQMVRLNPNEAIHSFVKVDEGMLTKLCEKAPEISDLSRRISACFKRGGRLFLSGCGATGRLSLVIENLWRQHFPERGDEVIGFMAGGDLALIHSIEKFEDFPSYGARQLEELGFGDKDLLLASTEGGETPWVIGTAEKAVMLGGECTFLFCNPQQVLEEKLERCKRIFENSEIVLLNLTSGPQALTGSTRLQASTILTAAIGAALFEGQRGRGSVEEISEYLSQLKDWYLNLDHTHLRPFIEKEFQVYQKGKGLYYLPDKEIAISVLTDTTERSPTFSLSGFDNKFEEQAKPSLCYLGFTQSADSEEAWNKLLYRRPRPLDWAEVSKQAGAQRLLGFDFSRDVFRWRGERVKEYSSFEIHRKEDTLLLELDHVQGFFPLPKALIKDHSLATHLILKMLLNMHSTLLMGLMGRYESNVMTYVRPSNNKLVDRCVRYASQLLREKGIDVKYEALVLECFHLMEEKKEDRAVVLELFKIFSTH